MYDVDTVDFSAEKISRLSFQRTKGNCCPCALYTLAANYIN
jgi:phosphoribosyl-dephospho-CoA transferase